MRIPIPEWRISLALFFTFSISFLNAQVINRKGLVQRHIVKVTTFDPLSSLSVGNGKFAFTVDATGLQTFPERYEKGVALGTQSEWGWHSFIDVAGYQHVETLKQYNLNGRTTSYSVQWNEPERNKNAANWFRQNPHRLQLGNIGLELTKKDGSPAGIDDIQNIRQQLDPWTGEIKSYFTLENVPVDVSTYCHQDEDQIASNIRSNLIREGRLKVRLRFPYPTGEWADMGTNYTNADKHTTSVETTISNGATILHLLDTTRYYIDINWKNNGSITQKQKHDFVISPAQDQTMFAFSCRFSPNKKLQPVVDFYLTELNSIIEWQQFWNRGAAIDFSGSTDPRANELERRVVLSQYLTKIQCAGSYPPQETGLTYNSWFGKPHLEMHWWHGVHFALWDRAHLLEKSVDWYAIAEKNAKKIASRQGYQGIRWQKMTDNAGEESPSSVGSFLIWQQPHFIYFAELLHRQKKDLRTLNKYKNLVFATADFMASYAFYEKEKDRFILGKGLIPAQERFKPEETFNPTYELAYWHWALSMAQEWRERLKMPRQKKWDSVLKKLSPLPVQNNFYLAAESAPDSYTNPDYRTDHPSVLGALGILPASKMVDQKIMSKTFNLVWTNWSWNDTWGWDFPMTAMTATRLGLPEKAIDALLMNIKTNTYLPNGHNYQDDRLRLYLPGNGGLLTAVAMMCAGYDGSKEINPGIPKNGKWKVKWEGLKKMP
ncbi:MAG: hypothetical protein H7122_02710 [Chitinophagaceae bacterium]|nr:hypothetical protein [Chitinophagaceae bacterium]